MTSDTEQLRAEINNVLTRYGKESDITVVEALGVIELVKQELIDQLKQSQP